MIEDMQHVGVCDALAKELQDNLVEYNRQASGVKDKKTLLAIRIAQNDILREILRKQLRHLRYMNGEKIEPETHYVEAEIFGFGGVDPGM